MIRNNIGLFLIAVLGAFLIVTNMSAIKELGTTRPAFVEFGEITVLTDTSALCPGDVIEFTAEVNVARPTIIMRGEQVWRDDIVATATTAQIAYTVVAEPENFSDIVRKFTVPDLPPGEYHRDGVFVLPGQAAAAVGHRIPFTIRENCTE